GFAAGATSQSYDYDADGNRISQTVAGASPTAYEYFAGTNHLQGKLEDGVQTASYSYSARGDLSSDQDRTYTYHGNGRLAQTVLHAGMPNELTLNFEINALGQRVKKTVSSPTGSSAVSRFVYDQAGHVIGEYDENGSPRQEYVYLGDM